MTGVKGGVLRLSQRDAFVLHCFRFPTWYSHAGKCFHLFIERNELEKGSDCFALCLFRTQNEVLGPNPLYQPEVLITSEV